MDSHQPNSREFDVYARMPADGTNIPKCQIESILIPDDLRSVFLEKDLMGEVSGEPHDHLQVH